jgi:hypothetical protein
LLLLLPGQNHAIDVADLETGTESLNVIVIGVLGHTAGTENGGYMLSIQENLYLCDV